MTIIKKDKKQSYLYTICVMSIVRVLESLRTKKRQKVLNLKFSHWTSWIN